MLFRLLMQLGSFGFQLLEPPFRIYIDGVFGDFTLEITNISSLLIFQGSTESSSSLRHGCNRTDHIEFLFKHLRDLYQSAHIICIILEPEVFTREAPFCKPLKLMIGKI